MTYGKFIRVGIAYIVSILKQIAHGNYDRVVSNIVQN
jgi:hypothetical protein